MGPDSNDSRLSINNLDELLSEVRSEVKFIIPGILINAPFLINLPPQRSFPFRYRGIHALASESSDIGLAGQTKTRIILSQFNLINGRSIYIFWSGFNLADYSPYTLKLSKPAKSPSPF